MKEIFKDIKDYEGLYQVSNLGRVKSLSRKGSLKEKVLKAGKCGKYLSVGLSNIGKVSTKRIHQLVAIAFLDHIPNGFNGVIVDHIDNNPSNNKLENLQLTTVRYNSSKDVKNKSSIYTGVRWCKSVNKWRSDIRVNGKKKYLGVFIYELDANNAYESALNEILTN